MSDIAQEIKTSEGKVPRRGCYWLYGNADYKRLFTLLKAHPSCDEPSGYKLTGPAGAEYYVHKEYPDQELPCICQNLEFTIGQNSWRLIILDQHIAEVGPYINIYEIYDSQGVKYWTRADVADRIWTATNDLPMAMDNLIANARKEQLAQEQWFQFFSQTRELKNSIWSAGFHCEKIKKLMSCTLPSLTGNDDDPVVRFDVIGRMWVRLGKAAVTLDSDERGFYFRTLSGEVDEFLLSVANYFNSENLRVIQKVVNGRIPHVSQQAFLKALRPLFADDEVGGKALEDVIAAASPSKFVVTDFDEVYCGDCRMMEDFIAEQVEHIEHVGQNEDQ